MVIDEIRPSVAELEKEDTDKITPKRGRYGGGKIERSVVIDNVCPGVVTIEKEDIGKHYLGLADVGRGYR